MCLAWGIVCAEGEEAKGSKSIVDVDHDHIVHGQEHRSVSRSRMKIPSFQINVYNFTPGQRGKLHHEARP